MAGYPKSILVTYLALILCQSIIDLNAVPLVGDKLKSAEEKYSFSVLIVGKRENSAKNEHLCVGSFISKNQILTAASCLKNWDLANVKALVSIPAGPKRRIKSEIAIGSKVTYEDYVNEANNEGKLLPPRLGDIAILEVSKKLSVADAETLGQIKPVKISCSTDLPPLDSEVKIVGFGREYAEKSAILKKYGTTKVMKKQLCYEKAESVTPYYKKLIWSNELYCVLNKVMVLAVDGDFGGPAVNEHDELLGITFRGRPMTEELRVKRKGQPNLILNLSFYRDFLERYIGKHCISGDVIVDS